MINQKLDTQMAEAKIGTVETPEKTLNKVLTTQFPACQ